MQIIDAGMLAYASWHALKGKVDWPLCYQFPRMLRPLIEEARDTYVLAWNGDDLWKRERFPAYRDRPEIWDEADADDFATLLDLLAALGAVQYRSPRLEADEVIAALVHRYQDDEELRLHSDDKDFMQLLSGTTRMRGRVRGEVRFSDVRGILGVSPAFVADYLALAGDEADGIPRILPPAKAREMIESRGHLCSWIDRDLRVDKKTRRKIEEQREQLRLNFELVDLSRAAVSRAGAPGDPLLDGWDDPGKAKEIGARTDIGWLQDSDQLQAFRVLREWGGKTRQRLGR